MIPKLPSTRSLKPLVCNTVGRKISNFLAGSTHFSTVSCSLYFPVFVYKLTIDRNSSISMNPIWPIQFWEQHQYHAGAVLLGGQGGHLSSVHPVFQRSEAKNLKIAKFVQLVCKYLLKMLFKFEVLPTQFLQDCAAPEVNSEYWMFLKFGGFLDIRIPST